MSFFADFIRGYRRGRGADDFSDVGPDGEEPDDGRDRTIAAQKRIIAAYEETIAALREETESLRAQLAGAGNAEGQQAADQRTRAQMREMESILAFPGVRTALAKALHPDTGAGGSATTRKEIFQTLMAVMDRLGIRG